MMGFRLAGIVLALACLVACDSSPTSPSGGFDPDELERDLNSPTDRIERTEAVFYTRRALGNGFIHLTFDGLTKDIYTRWSLSREPNCSGDPYDATFGRYQILAHFENPAHGRRTVTALGIGGPYDGYTWSETVTITAGCNVIEM